MQPVYQKFQTIISITNKRTRQRRKQKNERKTDSEKNVNIKFEKNYSANKQAIFT